MKFRTQICAVLVSATAMFSVTANADPVEYDGRHYEFVPDLTVATDWDRAKSLAEGMDHNGVRGHLATIGDEDEDEFIRKLANGEVVLPSGHADTHPAISGEYWVGGFQTSPCADTTADPTCGWEWLNGDPIEGTNAGLVGYANWLDGEPNDYNGTKENHIGIGHRGYAGNYGWNDEGNPNIVGFVVEYGERRDVEPDCDDDGICRSEVGPGVVLTTPEGEVPEDPTVIVDSIVVVNDAATCNDGPREFFAGDVSGSITVPQYYCGKPNLFIVKTTSDFEFSEGTVLIVTDTSPATGNMHFRCENSPTISDEMFTGAGLYRWMDAIGWRTTAFGEDMQEEHFENLDPGFEFTQGDMFEATGGCGSTKGRSRGKSYVVSGGGWNLAAGGTALEVRDEYIKLTRYKLAMLEESVEFAKPALKRGDYKKLSEQMDNVIKHFDDGAYEPALTELYNFRKFVDKATYADVGYNNHGEHVSRYENALYLMLDRILLAGP